MGSLNSSLSFTRHLWGNICAFFDPTIAIEPIALRGLGSAAAPRVQFGILNNGKTTAHELVIGGVCLIEPFTESGDLLFPTDRIKRRAPMTLPRGARINTEISQPYPLTEDEWHMLHDGSWRLCAFVLLAYRHFFGAHREKLACFEVKIDFVKGQRDAGGEFSGKFMEVPVRRLEMSQ